MYNLIHINEKSREPKYKQIVRCITEFTQRGLIESGMQLPSINELSNHLNIARDTVEKAYKQLKIDEIIEGVHGKGFYICSNLSELPRILLVMNKLSAYKKIIYETFIKTLGNKAKTELFIHHGNIGIFEDIWKEHQGKYHHYVVMPHFYDDAAQKKVCDLLNQIPPNQLILLDKNIPALTTSHAAVFQDFKNDVYEALCSGIDVLDKYKELVFVYPTDVKYPIELLHGFRSFCVNNQKTYRIIEHTTPENNLLNRAYIVLEESDLADLIKKSKQNSWQLGKDVGILSFNDTLLKEVLADGITVISTDHALMGQTAAQLILEKRIEKIKNPFALIRRMSL